MRFSLALLVLSGSAGLAAAAGNFTLSSTSVAVAIPTLVPINGTNSSSTVSKSASTRTKSTLETNKPSSTRDSDDATATGDDASPSSTDDSGSGAAGLYSAGKLGALVIAVGVAAAGQLI